LDDVPQGANVGLRVFGMGQGCTDSELLVEPFPGQVSKIQNQLAELKPKGSKAPLARAILQAYEKDFQYDAGNHNSLIVVTTGVDTCDKDGLELAQVTRKIEQLDFKADAYIVGLSVTDPIVHTSLQALAAANDGVYLPVDTTTQLEDTLNRINENLKEGNSPTAIAPTLTPTPTPTSTPRPTPTIDPATAEGLEHYPLKIGEIGFVEAKLMLDENIEASHGTVTTGIGFGSWWLHCDVGSRQGNQWAWAICHTTDGFGTTGVSVPFNSWSTIRFDINPDTATIIFSVDGRQLGGSYIPSNLEEFKQADFHITLLVWSEAGGLITGYADDMRIGPFGQQKRITTTKSESLPR
jgi:hypothetical protein